MADGRAIEHHFDVAHAPHLAVLLVAEHRLEAERVEELDGQLEALHAGLHFLAHLHAAFERHRSLECRQRVAAELAYAQQRTTRAQLAAPVEHDVVFERFGIKLLRSDVMELADQRVAVLEGEFDFDFLGHG
jgi:hypothetical protein